jgi:hypothetical protein
MAGMGKLSHRFLALGIPSDHGLSAPLERVKLVMDGLEQGVAIRLGGSWWRC